MQSAVLLVDVCDALEEQGLDRPWLYPGIAGSDSGGGWGGSGSIVALRMEGEGQVEEDVEVDRTTDVRGYVWRYEEIVLR